MKLAAMIAYFKDSELVEAILTVFRRKKEQSSMINSNEGEVTLRELLQVSSDEDTEDELYTSEIENFVTADWQDNVAIMLCVKCEEPFNIDPLEDTNLIFCYKKRVLVPQCPHCGANDVET